MSVFATIPLPSLMDYIARNNYSLCCLDDFLLNQLIEETRIYAFDNILPPTLSGGQLISALAARKECIMDSLCPLIRMQ